MSPPAPLWPGSSALPAPVGSILIAMVYMGDHVCGADYNPAVTVGVALRMAVPWRELWKVAVTVIAQVCIDEGAGHRARRCTALRLGGVQRI
jgi:hypothetical protein